MDYFACLPRYILFLHILLRAVDAYERGNAIGSCVDVGCPANASRPLDGMCRVVDNVFAQIGLTSISTAVSEDNLTWTVGYRIYGSANTTERYGRIVEKALYLGTPPTLDLTSPTLPYQGCALFIVNNTVEFGQEEAGTCSDVLPADCSSSLVRQVISTINGPVTPNQSAEQACQDLQTGLEQNLPETCSEVLGKSAYMHVQAVTGNTAPSPPSPSENTTSNCHPTLPKSNELAFIYGFNTSGTVYAGSTLHLLNSPVLILTAFFSGDNASNTDSRALDQPDVQLSCLKAVPLTQASLDNMVAGRGSSITVTSVALMAAVLGAAFYVLVMN